MKILKVLCLSSALWMAGNIAFAGMNKVDLEDRINTFCATSEISKWYSGLSENMVEETIKAAQAQVQEIQQKWATAIKLPASHEELIAIGEELNKAREQEHYHQPFPFPTQDLEAFKKYLKTCVRGWEKASSSINFSGGALWESLPYFPPITGQEAFSLQSWAQHEKNLFVKAPQVDVKHIPPARFQQASMHITVFWKPLCEKILEPLTLFEKKD